jgi:hypothetical protein
MAMRAIWLNAELRSREELRGTLRGIDRSTSQRGSFTTRMRGRETPQRRGLLAEPTMLLVIKEEVCEGVGDYVK